MIRTIIIDDEDYVRYDVRERVEEFFPNEVEIIAEAASSAEAYEAIVNHSPDLLLLDIDLGDGTAFDLLERFNDHYFDVIFVTGYDQHAIKAIKVGALDYLLKPIDDVEFKEAVNKAIHRDPKEQQLQKLLEVSSEFFKGATEKRVILKTAETVYAVYENDIIYCRSDGNYTTFYTQQMEKIVVSKSIKKIEEILSEDVFIRCHQSYIVNKKHVLKYNKKGVLIVHLDFKVPVSSRRKDYALKRIFD